MIRFFLRQTVTQPGEHDTPAFEVVDHAEVKRVALLGRVAGRPLGKSELQLVRAVAALLKGYPEAFDVCGNDVFFKVYAR